MLVLASWLREKVSGTESEPFEAPIEEVAERLTLAGLEVEALEPAWPWLDEAVAAKVVSAEPAPDRPEIKICRVSTGRDELVVVCGAPNVREGMVTALVPAGTQMPDGKEVKEAELYGVRSQGMLCSERELFMVGDGSGIMELEAEAGTRLGEHFGLKDIVLEIGITPNRPDCLSITGVAREAAALYGLALKAPEGAFLEDGPFEQELSISIEDPELCSRYAGILMDGIKVADSPRWMALRLLACGVRPINNIVDITNYVLLETGQPLHAFDFDTLHGGRIVVRTARAGETIVTLDGKERKLDPSVLVICDADRPVAVAGVMGGLETEVTDGTERVLIESAWFKPTSIRRTAKALKLPTEASYRFERGVDPEGQMRAARMAAGLMADLAGGRVVGIRDENPRPHRRIKVEMRPARINSLIGAEIPAPEMARLLESIELKVTGPVTEESMEVEIPSFRPDISHEIDLVEEVARLYGFANIPTRMPVAPLATTEAQSFKAFFDEIRAILSGEGLCEIISYSFIGPKELAAFRLDEADERMRPVKLLNPLAEDQSIMRTFLAPCMLSAISRNTRRRNLDLHLFEIGAVFIHQAQGELPKERYQLAMAVTGRRFPLSWAWPQEPADFFDLKGRVEGLLSALNVKGVRFTPAKRTEPYFVAGTQLDIEGDGARALGRMGQVNRAVLDAFDLEQALFLCEIDLEALSAALEERVQFRPLPRYPAVELDLALLLDDGVRASEILDFIRQKAPSILEDIVIFDLYRGKQVPKGKKSVAIRFVYRAPDRTLSDADVEQVHEPLVEALLSHFDAQLRA